MLGTEVLVVGTVVQELYWICVPILCFRGTDSNGVLTISVYVGRRTYDLPLSDVGTGHLIHNR